MSSVAPVLHLRCPSSDVMAGGATRVVWQIAASVDRERFPSYPCFAVNALEGERSELVEAERDGIPYYVSRGARFVDPRHLARIAGIARRRGVRIVHCHDYKSDIFGLFLMALLPACRFVTTLHGYIANSRKGKLYCALDKRLVRLYRRILIVASPMREFFPPRLQSKIVWVPNAVDTQRFTASPEAARRRAERGPGQPLVIGYAGRVSLEKGWREFVEIAARLAAQGLEARYVVAGDGPEQTAMRREVEARGLAGRFELLGGIEDMPGFYDRIDLLLAPSRTEGMPLVQLEACAMAAPVVATRVGGVGDLIEHGANGLLAERGDVATLAAHVLDLANDPARAARMGEEGMRRVRETFSAEAQARRIEEVYASVLGPREGGDGP